MESLERAAFPLIGAALVSLARAIADPFMDTALLEVALVPLVGIGLITGGVRSTVFATSGVSFPSTALRFRSRNARCALSARRAAQCRTR
jgi:hypothetical protein